MPTVASELGQETEIGAALISIVQLWEAVLFASSSTETENVKVPAADGVPLTLAPEAVRLVGNAPVME